MKKKLLTIGFVPMLGAGLPIHAQDDCTDSPETPTAILAAGSAGALLAAIRIRKSK